MKEISIYLNGKLTFKDGYSTFSFISISRLALYEVFDYSTIFNNTLKWETEELELNISTKIKQGGM